MDFERLRQRDRLQLRDRFYQAFDRSRAEAMLRLPNSTLDREAVFLGEGQHFRAWRLGRPGHPGAALPAPAPLSLVLKRAGPGFGPPGGPSRRAWVSRVMLLSGAGGLVPPFEICEAEGHLGLVMPFGDRTLAEAAPHWQPLAERLAELDQVLAARGLALGDVPQGRSLGGVPFVYDLSDVQVTDDR